VRASWLDWTADPPGVSSGRHLVAFRTLLLAHLAVQAWAWSVHELPPPYTFPPLTMRVAAVWFTFLCGISLATDRGRLACALALPAFAAAVAWTFPVTANHWYLALVLLGLCSVFDPEREGESVLLIQGLRWLAVLVFFWAGAQKLLHGLYFRGEFMTWMIANGVERWSDIFGWMLPDGEVERLRALRRYQPGAGPYRVDSALFLLANNAVWVGELALAVLMGWRRTRQLAAFAAIALVFTIQTAPREFMFALLYTNLLLLFVRGEPNRRLLPLFLAAYAYLVAVLFGAPGAFLLKAGGGL